VRNGCLLRTRKVHDGNPLLKHHDKPGGHDEAAHPKNQVLRGSGGVTTFFLCVCRNPVVISANIAQDLRP
jgi:hypothetical protein